MLGEWEVRFMLLNHVNSAHLLYTNHTRNPNGLLYTCVMLRVPPSESGPEHGCLSGALLLRRH